MPDEIPPGRRAELDQEAAMVKEVVDALVVGARHYRVCPDPEHREQYRVEILGGLVQQERILVQAVVAELLSRLAAHEDERSAAETLARVLFGGERG